MNERDFCYWLQGFFELNTENKTIDLMQKEIIKDHLKLVFDKQTPDYDMTITTTGHEPSDFLTPRESIIC